MQAWGQLKSASVMLCMSAGELRQWLRWTCSGMQMSQQAQDQAGPLIGQAKQAATNAQEQLQQVSAASETCSPSPLILHAQLVAADFGVALRYSGLALAMEEVPA